MHLNSLALTVIPKTNLNKTTTFSSYSQKGKVSQRKYLSPVHGEAVKKKHRLERTMHKLIREEVLQGTHTISSGDRERCNGEHVVCCGGGNDSA